MDLTPPPICCRGELSWGSLSLGTLTTKRLVTGPPSRGDLREAVGVEGRSEAALVGASAKAKDSIGETEVRDKPRP